MVTTIYVTTFDCHDPVRVAKFWATALGYLIDDRNGPAEIQLSDPAGVGHGLYFMKVPEAKTVKNRLHLDLRTDAVLADEANRLVRAGARVLSTRRDPPGFYDPYEWTVMQDPEFNEFCIVRPLGPSTA